MEKSDWIVDPARAAALEVFETMLAIPAEPGEAYWERTAPGPSDGLIAVVGMAGAWVGSGSFCCSADLARRIASALLMTPYEEVDDDVLDAVAEVANMIVGNFKTEAEKTLGPLGLGIPTVIYGMNFVARSSAKEQWLVLPFHAGDEPFEIRICLTPNRGVSRLAHSAA